MRSDAPGVEIVQINNKPVQKEVNDRTDRREPMRAGAGGNEAMAADCLIDCFPFCSPAVRPVIFVRTSGVRVKTEKATVMPGAS